MASVLGKRSRVPLAEKSTNAKKAKSLDSHPGENQTKRSRSSRIIDDSSDEDLADIGGESSKSGAQIDDENLGEDLFDQEVYAENIGEDLLGQEIYDEDTEDVEDGNTVDTAEWDTVETAKWATQLRE